MSITLEKVLREGLVTLCFLKIAVVSFLRLCAFLAWYFWTLVACGFPDSLLNTGLD